MDKRADKRSRRRIPCTLQVDGERHAGIVLDLSKTGLFVQTARLPLPGAQVDVHIPLGDRAGAELWLRCTVARHRRVPPRLVTVASGGLGLRLVDAPPAYRDLLELVRGERKRAAPPAPPPDERPLFRVRASQLEGMRSRVLELRGASPAEASAAALSRLGSGWQVLEVTQLAAPR